MGYRLFSFCCMLMLAWTGCYRMNVGGVLYPGAPSYGEAVLEDVFNPQESGFISQRTFGMVIASFKDFLYAALWDWKYGLQLLRSPDGLAWNKVDLSALKLDPCYSDTYQLFVHRGWMYMALHDCWVCDLPGLVLRSADGLKWEIVLQDTPDHALFGQSLPDKLGAANGFLYLTTRGFTGQLWRSPNGGAGTWQLVNPVLGKYVDSTSPLLEFHGKVYVAEHDEGGMHVWRSMDGLNWESMGQGVLDDPANLYDGSMVVFQDAIYLSTANWIYKTPYEGGRIYRSTDGVEWELVVDRGFSGLNPGGIEGLLVYDDVLYAFASDLVANRLYIWQTRSGDAGDWHPVNPGGYGPEAMTLRCGQVIHKKRIYVANSFGQGDDLHIIRISLR